MTRKATARPGTIVVILIVLLSLLVLSRSASAQDSPPPPAVGVTILEDALSGPSLVQPFSCRNGRAGYDYVGEGLRLKLTGACNDGEIFAGTGPPLRGLTLLDGELRMDVKAVSGIDHVRFNINVRSQPFTPGAMTSVATVPASYAVAIEPGHGRALIGKVGSQVIERDDLAGSLSVDDWNTVGIRLQGPNFWLLLNEQAVLVFSDDSLEHGDVTFGLLKMSDTPGPQRARHDPNDTSEAAVVVRNLRISALADGDPARMPTYQRP